MQRESVQTDTFFRKVLIWHHFQVLRETLVWLCNSLFFDERFSQSLSIMLFRVVGRCFRTAIWLWTSWTNCSWLSRKRKMFIRLSESGSPPRFTRNFQSLCFRPPSSSRTILRKAWKLDWNGHTQVSSSNRS